VDETSDCFLVGMDFTQIAFEMVPLTIICGAAGTQLVRQTEHD